jgi:hypothetical protein
MSKDEDEVENRTGPSRNNYVNHPSMCPMHRDHGFARIRGCSAHYPAVCSVAALPGYGDKNITLLICSCLPDLKLGALPTARVNSVSVAKFIYRK